MLKIFLRETNRLNYFTNWSLYCNRMLPRLCSYVKSSWLHTFVVVDANRNCDRSIWLKTIWNERDKLLGPFNGHRIKSKK